MVLNDNFNQFFKYSRYEKLIYGKYLISIAKIE